MIRYHACTAAECVGHTMGTLLGTHSGLSSATRQMCKSHHLLGFAVFSDNVEDE